MKSQDINVAIFPIGSVIKLKKEFLKRSDGSSEYYKLIWLLCRQEAISQVTLVQKSDWDKLSDEEKAELDPRGVIFDVYSEYALKTPQNVTNTTQPEATHYLWETIKDLPKPDFGIAFPAQGFAMINIPNFLPQLRDPSKLCAALNMTVRYAGPIVDYINRSNIKWYWIATDPRYCESKIKRRDVANVPLEILAQYNDTVELTTIDEYRNDSPETAKKINVVYTGIEKLNLVNENIVSPENERSNKFSIVAMQSSYGKDNIKDYRFNVLKKWVFKYDENNEAKVYGKWADIFTKDNPQFKGFIDHTEVDKMFENTRYTLVIPIRPNWVTSKYAEMLRVGVVPFLHPDYDTQHNVVPEDHFIRLKSPEDFYKKMQYLDENPEKRIALVKSLQVKLLKGVRKGEFVIEMLNKHNQANGIEVFIPFGFDETVKRTVKKTVKLF
jgi:hypothetical protein